MSLSAIVAGACGGTAAPVAASASPTAARSAGAATATPQPTMQKIVVAFSEIYEGALPMWYAQEKGIFQKNFVDPDLRFIASSTGVAALLAGEVQLFHGGGSEVVSAVAGGADLLMVGNLVPIYPYVFMVSANVKTLADLKGKKVGVSSPGSTSDIATRVGLAKLGIDPDKDVTIVAVGSSQNRTAALLSGAIQGGLDQPPGSIVLESKGLHSLFDMASQKLPVVNNGITLQRSYVGANRPIVQRYMDSLVQSIAALRKDKPGALEVLQKQLGEKDQKVLGATYDYAMGLFPSQPYAKIEAFADSIRVLSATNPKIAGFDAMKILDDSFVKSAVDRGLDK
ncbi:MAG: ABC transporter substrate-binding protein [Chloroflexi bacterium]|nr:ABC transporter substrate-binding protein [Chloroflexota bacterium]